MINAIHLHPNAIALWVENSAYVKEWLKVDNIKVGNINTSLSPLTHCSTGVDCSGFVSNLWSLKRKWGSWDFFNQRPTIQLVNLNIGDVLVKPGQHVMLFSSRENDQLTTFEAVVRPGKVIMSQHPLSWFLQHGYVAKSAPSQC